jgi:hypothetical protein
MSEEPGIFDLTRAFDQDAQENRDAIKQNGKLKVPLQSPWNSPAWK